MNIPSQDLRSINDILKFRSDNSPFLVHLTRDFDGIDAKKRLQNIFTQRQLIPSCNPISDARFSIYTHDMSEDDKCRFFGAICFTETPLNEVHCLLDIQYRQVNLRPYGLVFLKEALKKKNVGPVYYINNEKGDKSDTISKVCGLIKSSPEAAECLIPMFAVFGNKLVPPSTEPKLGNVDFLWEREWRLPKIHSPLEFNDKDVFVGLCPHEEITYFESQFPGIDFIDPLRNMKWYATKLIQVRQRLDLKISVI